MKRYKNSYTVKKITDFINAVSFSSVTQLREVWLATSRWIYPRVLQNQHSMVSIAQCVTVINYTPLCKGPFDYDCTLVIINNR